MTDSRKIPIAQSALPEPKAYPVEFFFYAPTEDAAAALSISLQELGYTLYERSYPDMGPDPVCVTGRTPSMSQTVEATIAWYEAMEILAETHGCFFDGYGSPDGPDDVM